MTDKVAQRRGDGEAAGGEAAVISAVDGPVTRITLNRPRRRNAVDGAMCELLHAELRAARDRDGCRVVVIDGAGPALCAGWDLNDIAAKRAGGDRDGVRAAFEGNRELLRDLAEMPQVTIAQAHGAVMGFGISLVARCDLAVAGAGARFALPEVAHGVVPGIVMLDVLAVVAPKTALDWLVSGREVSAEQALAAGLVGEVVDDAALGDHVDALARRIAAHPPTAVAATKRLAQELRDVPPAVAEATAIAASVDALMS